MSPSPDLSSQPSQPSSAEPNSSELEASQPELVADTPDSETSNSTDSSSAEAPVLRKPPMRPVRPQPPAQSPAKPSEPTSQPAAKSETLSKPIASKLEILSVSSATAPSVPIPAAPQPLSEEEQAAQAAMRQQPIPPPSEPKQYRAIGLVRGHYTPSEEEFTRGDFKAADGSDLKAVLLGRVMSLVKNHIDLQKEHLWVVYPRTREEEKELHLQIVGVWEPETLKKPEEGGEATTDAIDSSTLDPSLNIDYFSVRGEVVFISPEENHVVVKIQQTPRKSTQKAKAFKLSIRGELEGTRTVGYFWDLHIKREDNTLVVTGGTCIGMAPPKRRDKDLIDKGRPRKPSFGRGGGAGRPPMGRSPRPSGGLPRPTRDPVSKPIKRSEQNPTPED